ncbi:LysE family translocator [Vibrio barjaei]|uniref:LysE family translocator n=2 Tax=Vibrio TaxID=662 RepID=A0ABW7IGT7_9VIBR
MTIHTIIAFAGIVFLLAVIPGPNALLILYTSLTEGKRLAFVNILGISCGFLIHAFVTAKGLSLIIAHSYMAFSALKWLGVGYLLWLGVSNIRKGLSLSKPMLNTDKPPLNTTLVNSFYKGLFTNLLNPKIILFYLSIFPQFTSPENIVTQSIVLGFVHAFVVASWFIIVILFASKMKSLLTSSKAAKYLNYASGGLFISFAAGLARARL